MFSDEFGQHLGVYKTMAFFVPSISIVLIVAVAAVVADVVVQSNENANLSLNAGNTKKFIKD